MRLVYHVCWSAMAVRSLWHSLVGTTCANGDIAMMTMLIAKGADFNAKDNVRHGCLGGVYGHESRATIVLLPNIGVSWVLCELLLPCLVPFVAV